MNVLPNRSRPDRRPQGGSERPERDVERSWYRTPWHTVIWEDQDGDAWFTVTKVAHGPE